MNEIELICDPEGVPDGLGEPASGRLPAWRYGVSLSGWQCAAYVATLSAPGATWATSGTYTFPSPLKNQQADVVHD